MSVLLRSIKLAAIATILCIIIAYPLAYILSRKQGFQKQTLFVMVMLPMWMNFLLRTLAWQTLLEKNGVINSILNFLHLPEQSIINTPSAIVLGMVYNFLPFMVLPIYNVLSKIDKDVIHAATISEACTPASVRPAPITSTSRRRKVDKAFIKHSCTLLPLGCICQP